MKRSTNALFRIIEEALRDLTVPAASIRDQLPASTLPPGGIDGSGYPPANTSVTTGKLADDSVTYAKMQNVSAASKLLGRGDSSAGDPQEITLGTGLSMSGTTLSSSGGGALTVEEVDGTPSGVVDTLQLPNGTVSIVGSVATYTPAVGSTPAHAYYDLLCALLEPDALEPLHVGTGSVSVTTTKYLMLGWALTVSTGRIEVRDPREPLALNDITISGLGTSSTMVLLDPSLPTYSDSWTTYHDRLLAIATLPTQIVEVAAGGTFYPFLPGPYGCIITGNTVFNVAWLALRSTGGGGADLALNFELGDATTDWVRFGQQLRVPITKLHACGVETGLAGGVGSPAGSLTYVILPSTWGVITDPNAYAFRDDFMGASLDTTTVWTRAQSTSGNVEIKTTFQWLGMFGDGNWGTNGCYTQTGIARAAGLALVVDVFCANASPNLVVGWSDGLGHSYTNFAHGVDFSGGALTVFEGGTSRGTVGSGIDNQNIYRLRITLGASDATYEIQGGAYATLGGATWTDITPGTSSSTTTPLHPGATINSAEQCWLGDMRVIS